MHDRGRMHHSYIVDEGFVDLQLGERHPPQIGEARISDSEIVEGQANAETAQMPELRLRRARIRKERRLDDLQLEARQGKTCLAHAFDQPLDKASLLELRRRDIDTEHEARPSQSVPAGARQYPCAELVGETVRLDRIQEIRRAERPTHGMLPAYQRLHPRDSRAVGEHLRLINEKELVPFKGPDQLLSTEHP